MTKKMQGKAQENQLIINLEEVNSLAIQGGKLMYTPDAERAIVGLLTLKEIVDRHIEEIKGKIAAAGKKLDPNFKGVVGQEVKSIYRSYGEKYEYDGTTKMPDGALKEIVTVKVDSKFVESYVKVNGKLPKGITEKERVPVLSLTKIDYEPEPRAIE